MNIPSLIGHLGLVDFAISVNFRASTYKTEGSVTLSQMAVSFLPSISVVQRFMLEPLIDDQRLVLVGTMSFTLVIELNIMQSARLGVGQLNGSGFVPSLAEVMFS